MFIADDPLTRPTPYDIGFRLWGYAVRIHPLFWVAMAILGFLSAQRDLVYVLFFMACGFVSILLHEYGHGLTARWFRCDPVEVVLHGMGGHCAYSPARRLGPWRRIAITAAGPLVNAALALASWGLIRTLGSHLSPRLFDLVAIMLIINAVWAIFNLLPIFPLDGSQIAISLIEIRFQFRALEWGLYLSIASLILITIWSWSAGWLEGANWLILFGLIAGNVAQLRLLRSQGLIGGSGGGWSSSVEANDDPADWWKR